MAVTTDAYAVWHGPRKEDYMAVKRNELQLHKTIWLRPGARLQIFHDAMTSVSNKQDPCHIATTRTGPLLVTSEFWINLRKYHVAQKEKKTHN